MKLSCRAYHVLIAALLISANAWSRGGGGCFERGTQIATPDGLVAIEQLKAGDQVFSRDHGKQQIARVVSTTTVDPDHYIVIKFPGSELHVTDEHLIAIKPGVYRRAASLGVNDQVIVWQNNNWQPVNITSTSRLATNKPAYNLLVDSGSTFVANHALVHNKGCFLPETPVLRADGNMTAISAIRPGDEVIAYEPDGKMVKTSVHAVIKHHASAYYMLTTKDVVVNVTGEHPFYVGDGTFKTVESLTAGDMIYAFDGKHLAQQKILAIKHINSETTVYNLQTDEPHTYFAAGIAVHNKGGGCFPAGTRVQTPEGTKPIELLAPGDEVLSLNRSGLQFTTTVQSTYATRSPVLTFVTNLGTLHTTDEHPIAVRAGQFKRADQLRVNDEILFYGKNSLNMALIQSIVHEPDALVFNLETRSPHTFLADHILVHNKGGFGGRSRSRSCPKGDTACERMSFLLGIVIFIFWLFLSSSKFITWLRGESSGDEDLDYLNSRANILRKSQKTMKLIDFLAKQDTSMQPDLLIQRARDVFLKLQDCWVKRDYRPMQTLMMPDLYKQHLRQIDGMIRNHEINQLKNLRIDNIDLVNVRYTENKYSREFTALITATVADYYIDDRTDAFLRGSKQPESFQEFWTFILQKDGWLLWNIEQSRESDYLKEENFVEMFTDLQIQKIYGGSVDDLGSSGPWLPTAVEQKENKVDRMLNFLSRSNKMWDRSSMIVRVRSVFTQVHMAFEAGVLDDETAKCLYQDVAEEMRQTLAAWRATGNSIEYRNFCVRKVEILLVESYDDKSKNEFTARISAHAQIIHRKNTAIISSDDDVSLFVEYWEFGQMNDQWNLKNAKPQSDQDILSAENIEEGSSPNLVKWYYTKKRAL